MLRDTGTVLTGLLVISSCSAFRRSLKLKHELNQRFNKSERSYPELYHDQILDHFDATNTKRWPQRYWENLDVYSGSGVGFLFIGGESEESPLPLDNRAWCKSAKENGAAMFVLEHRFYGQSKPTEDLRTENMKYLSSRQALEDTGHFISAMNRRYNLTTWVTFGASYSGSLSAWMRIKFPHLVTGSVSSSGPLFAKLDYSEYLQVVADALDTTGPGCNIALTEALTKIEMMVEMEDTWLDLSNKFKLCSTLDGLNTMDVRSFMENLIGNLAGIVQYNGSYPRDIFSICSVMTDESLGDPVDRLAAVYEITRKMDGEECLDHTYDAFLQKLTNTSFNSGDFELRQWTWQTCTEFGWFQTTNQEGSVYGGSLPLEFFERRCSDAFGEEFNHEMLANNVANTNIEYGGFQPSVSNVVFVHGSIDPWHAMGVLEDLNESAPSIFIPGTSHCADMYPDSPEDPEELSAARVRIGELVNSWVCQKISSVCRPQSE